MNLEQGKSILTKLLVVGAALSIGACSINSGCKATREVWKSDDMNFFEKVFITSRIWHR